MLTPSDIELTDREILDVEEEIINDQIKKFRFVKDAFECMPQDIGTRWHNALMAREGLPLIEAMEAAILHLAKETDVYNDYINHAKQQRADEENNRLRRRVSNE